MKKRSIKNTRINEEVLRELSNIIRGEVKDPRVSSLTSVVAVEVAPDLKTAKAYILYRENHKNIRFIKERIDYIQNYVDSHPLFLGHIGYEDYVLDGIDIDTLAEYETEMLIELEEEENAST